MEAILGALDGAEDGISSRDLQRAVNLRATDIAPRPASWRRLVAGNRRGGRPGSPGPQGAKPLLGTDRADALLIRQERRVRW